MPRLRKKPEEYMHKNVEGRIGTSIDLAVSYLSRGGIVAFPTETYYGLAVDPDCVEAVDRLFTVKDRPSNKPLILLIEKIEQLLDLAEELPDAYKTLIERYWPGPLTLVLQAKASVYYRITGGTGTVGVRISPHPLAKRLVQRLGKPITATSANLSGLPPACSAQEVSTMFGESIDYILDGGKTAAGLCSTILGQQQGKLTILRRGQIDLHEVLSGR